MYSWNEIVRVFRTHKGAIAIMVPALNTVGVRLLQLQVHVALYSSNFGDFIPVLYMLAVVSPG